MRIHVSVLIGMAVLFGGCTASYQQRRVTENHVDALEPSASFLVAVNGDGKYTTTTYARSGQMASATMASVLNKHCKAEEATGYLTLEEAKKAGAENGKRYLVYLDILHWEDRATEWSGMPDRIEVKVSVVDLAQDSVLDSVMVTGKSKWMTFGGDHPQDLLVQPFEKYVAGLFKQDVAD